MNAARRPLAAVATLALVACGSHATHSDQQHPVTSGGAAPAAQPAPSEERGFVPAPGAEPAAQPASTSPAPAPAPASAAGGPKAIGLDATVEGDLEARDARLQDGSVGDDYVLELRAGQPITIVTRGGASVTLPGTQLDVYTLVLRDGTELTHDDDSAGFPNSRIVFTPPVDGRYTIRVSTFGAGLKEGHYTLQTYRGARETQQ